MQGNQILLPGRAINCQKDTRNKLFPVFPPAQLPGEFKQHEPGKQYERVPEQYQKGGYFLHQFFWNQQAKQGSEDHLSPNRIETECKVKSLIIHQGWKQSVFRELLTFDESNMPPAVRATQITNTVMNDQLNHI